MLDQPGSSCTLDRVHFQEQVISNTTIDPSSGAVPRPLEGHCLCGAVSIALHGANGEVDVCHCTMCQRWGGSFFGGVQGAAFDLSGRASVISYRSSEWAERAFCKSCGSHLWFRFIPADHYSLLAGLFELPTDTPLQIKQQIFVDEKPGWFDFAQSSPMKTGAQIIAEAKAAGFDLGNPSAKEDHCPDA